MYRRQGVLYHAVLISGPKKSCFQEAAAGKDCYGEKLTGSETKEK